MHGEIDRIFNHVIRTLVTPRCAYWNQTAEFGGICDLKEYK